MSNIDRSDKDLNFLQIYFGKGVTKKKVSRVRLSKYYNKLKEHIMDKSNGRCIICNATGGDAHHIIPRRSALAIFQGWPHHPDNLAFTCRTCNAAAESDVNFSRALGFLYKEEFPKKSSSDFPQRPSHFVSTNRVEELKIAGDDFYYPSSFPEYYWEAGSQWDTYNFFQLKAIEKSLNNHIKNGNKIDEKKEKKIVQLYDAYIKAMPGEDLNGELSQIILKKLNTENAKKEVIYRGDYASATWYHEENKVDKSVIEKCPSHVKKLILTKSPEKEIDVIIDFVKDYELLPSTLFDITDLKTFTDCTIMIFYKTWACVEQGCIEEALKYSKIGVHILDLKTNPVLPFHLSVRGYSLLMKYKRSKKVECLMNSLWCLSAGWNIVHEGNLAQKEQAGWTLYWYMKALAEIGFYEEITALGKHFQIKYGDCYKGKLNINAKKRIDDFLNGFQKNKKSTNEIIAKLREYVIELDIRFGEYLNEIFNGNEPDISQYRPQSDNFLQ